MYFFGDTVNDDILGYQVPLGFNSCPCSHQYLATCHG